MNSCDYKYVSHVPMWLKYSPEYYPYSKNQHYNSEAKVILHIAVIYSVYFIKRFGRMCFASLILTLLYLIFPEYENN